MELAAIVADRSGLIVHLSAPPEVIAARLTHRDGTAPDLPHINALLDRYTQIFAYLSHHALAITIENSQAA
jgi:predicted kinase